MEATNPHMPVPSPLPTTSNALVLQKGVTTLNLLSPTYRCHNEKAHHMQMRTIKGLLIPDILVSLYNQIIHEAAKTSKAVSPTFKLSVCVANHYKSISRLSLHDELGDRGAVISMSVGDSAVFVYKNSWKKHALLKRVVLESGDVLVFGVETGTCPSELKKIMDGRFNFNLRES
ncbi:hypothetical protein BCR33DRAFT_715587 [Rhizoclosmatium globosum]|uniref:Alpha-ketoglutarate-dependent dioxygenase AlkB-like domain-containing protein n=1 Tax=Rhizoclosmatium globosum TaxID=329046 RepID=A0A1Y2CJM2_9FUNG|nr:hypothetical protein BCR33DRAFT_715587 [Rhizoclosmatium globosum]|eukprot:ORY46535.1 hypothetical protein BCR33DRAFT_715587 [Rhizoclosmatium globosum]